MAALTIEYGHVDFDGTVDSVTVNLSEGFQHAPKVVVIPVELPAGSNVAGVNVFVDSITSAGFTIQASNKFIGRVQYKAILTE